MNKQTNETYGSEAGLGAGAAIGGYFGGPTGAMLGATLGSAAGSAIGGMFGGSSGPSYDQSWFDTRNAEIADYQNQLDSARAAYLGSLGSMYNDAYSRFSQNVQPQFANRGLQVNSGAFSQALAYKSAEYSAQLAPLAYDAQRQDLGLVNQARQSEWATEIAARTGGSNLGFSANQNNAGNIGSGLYSALNMYVNRPKPTPGMAAPSMWGNYGYGSQGGTIYGNGAPGMPTPDPLSLGTGNGGAGY